MSRLRCADLFCGAGGAAMGLSRAGFEVEGWDINPQPHYPFKFHLGNALDADLSGFDFVWASPPCQSYTRKPSAWGRKRNHFLDHPDLLAATRAKLKASGIPYVIENVPGASILAQLLLCGSMFGLRIIKHRYFEGNWPMPLAPMSCDHRNVFNPWLGKGRSAKEFREAQGTPWIPTGGGASRKKGITGDLYNAIPPAYSEFIGKHAIQSLRWPHNSNYPKANNIKKQA